MTPTIFYLTRFFFFRFRSARSTSAFGTWTSLRASASNALNPLGFFTIILLLFSSNDLEIQLSQVLIHLVEPAVTVSAVDPAMPNQVSQLFFLHISLEKAGRRLANALTGGPRKAGLYFNAPHFCHSHRFVSSGSYFCRIPATERRLERKSLISHHPPSVGRVISVDLGPL